MSATAEPTSWHERLRARAAAGEMVGRSGKDLTANVSSLSSPNNLVVLEHLMAKHQPEKTLEIGLALAASALVLCDGHRRLGREPGGQHVAVDPFQPYTFDYAGMDNLAHWGLDGYTALIPKPSIVALPQLAAEKRRFGLIYIDGSHVFEDAFCDFLLGHRLLEVGGMMLFDDCANPHVAKVLEFIRTNYTAFYRPLPLEDILGVTGVRAGLRQIAGRLGMVQITAWEKTADGGREWNAPYREF